MRHLTTSFFIFCYVLCGIDLSAQTWESLLPGSQRDDQFEITQSSSGEYFIAGVNKLITLNQEGELLSVAEATVFPGDFSHSHEDIHYYFISNRAADSLFVYAIDKTGKRIDTITVNYPGHTYSGGTEVVNHDMFIAQTNKTGTNEYSLISFNANGELLNQQSDFTRGRIYMTPYGKFYIINRSQIDEYDLDLNLVSTIILDEIDFVDYLDVAENGDLYFTIGDYLTGETTIGKVSVDGTITTNTFQTAKSDLTDSYGYPYSIAVGPDRVAILSTTIESNELLDVDCFNKDLELINGFDRKNGGFRSQIISNNSGGFTFGFGERIDPQETSFRAEKRAVFFALDANCRLSNAASRVTGRVFIDDNSNQEYDPTESPLQNIKLLILPDSIYTYTDDNGIYDVRINPGLNELSIVPLQNCFESDITYNFEATELSNGDTFDFPLQFFDDDRAVDIIVTTAPTRCNLTVPFFVTVRNDGCSSITGNLTLNNNNLLIKPAIEQDYSYEISDLSPYGQDRRTLYYTIPSEDFAGDTLELYLSFESAGISIDTTIRRVIRCGVDPNDKMIEPLVQDPVGENFAEIDQELTYTIRFQNLGNDTAFNIRVDDLISADFDMNTFQPLTESHAAHIKMYDDLVSYQFDDIQLPPASTDEPNSHGFVKFNIKVRADLPDFTLVNNTAEIFFDLNQPIITNTLSHVAVDVLDADEDGFYFWDDCDDLDSSVNPDKEEIVNNGIDEDCDGDDLVSSTSESNKNSLLLFPNPTNESLNIKLEDGGKYSIDVYNNQGQLLKSANDVSNLRLSDLSNGIYLVKLFNAQNKLSYIDKLVISR